MQKAIFKDAFLEKLPNTIRVETPVLSLDQDDWRYTASMDDSKKLLEDAGFNKFYKEELSPAAAEAEAQPSTQDPQTVTSEQAEQPSAPEYRENAGGTKLEFRLVGALYPEGSYRYNENQMVIDYLVENWGKAGIKLNIELYDTATLQAKMQSRDYDLLLYGQSLGYNLDLYGYFHSTQASETGLNLSNYKSFNVDMLIEAIRNTFNEDEATKKLKELAKAIQADIPAIFLYRPVYYYASDNKVEGLKLENMAYPADRFCHIEEWSFT
jgi:ABC-type transport system substrate-binding protein